MADYIDPSLDGVSRNGFSAGYTGGAPPAPYLPHGKWGRFDADTTQMDASRDRAYGYQNQMAGVGGQLGGTATGQGYHGQMRNAAAMEALAGPRTGPSYAELAMQRQSQQAQRQNLAMAASGTGASGNSLMLNAMNRNAMQQGELTQQLGIQRAQEDQQEMARRAAALQASGQMFGAGAQTQQNAYQGQGQMLGQIGAQNVQMTGMYGDIASQNAARAFDYYKEKQRQEEANTFTFKELASAGMNAAARVGAAYVTMGGSEVANAAQGSNGGWGPGYGDGYNVSDVRAKKDIKPAGGDVADMYRAIDRANASADAIRSGGTAPAFRPLSSSSYGYMDPANGQGTHYGPMAQELEQTPAGASVVVPRADGMKGIDTGRLALLNASETGQQRRELDELKAQLAMANQQGDRIRALPPAVRPGGYGY